MRQNITTTATSTPLPIGTSTLAAWSTSSDCLSERGSNIKKRPELCLVGFKHLQNSARHQSDVFSFYWALHTQKYEMCLQMMTQRPCASMVGGDMEARLQQDSAQSILLREIENKHACGTMKKVRGL